MIYWQNEYYSATKIMSKQFLVKIFATFSFLKRHLISYIQNTSLCITAATPILKVGNWGFEEAQDHNEVKSHCTASLYVLLSP